MVKHHRGESGLIVWKGTIAAEVSPYCHWVFSIKLNDSVLEAVGKDTQTRHNYYHTFCFGGTLRETVSFGLPVHKEGCTYRVKKTNSHNDISLWEVVFFILYETSLKRTLLLYGQKSIHHKFQADD